LEDIAMHTRTDSAHARSAGIAWFVAGAVFAIGWSAFHLVRAAAAGWTIHGAPEPWLYTVAYYAHTVPGTLALAAGAAQFALLRAPGAPHAPARPRLHAWLGRFYALNALLLGALGFAIGARAWGGFASRFGFQLLGALTVLTTLLAWRRIRQRDPASHAEWMTRSYALLLAFVTFRIWLLVFPDGLTNPESYTAAGWWTLLTNLAAAEAVNARRRSALMRRLGPVPAPSA
jgi:hypothetical protein